MKQKHRKRVTAPRRREKPRVQEEERIEKASSREVPLCQLFPTSKNNINRHTNVATRRNLSIASIREMTENGWLFSSPVSDFDMYIGLRVRVFISPTLYTDGTVDAYLPSNDMPTLYHVVTDNRRRLVIQFDSMRAYRKLMTDRITELTPESFVKYRYWTE